MALSFNLPDGLKTADLSEIEMFEDLIDDVVSKITKQSDLLQPVAFAFGALVNDGSFGAGESAPNLSLHYSKAHEVTWKTLMGVKEDLLSFQEACRKAKQEILDADQSSADQIRAVANVLGGAAGHAGRHSQEAYDRARNEAGDDEGDR